MSLFQKWLEIVIALRDNCFDLNGGGWGGRRKKWESFVLGVKWLPVEPRQQQQITTASNRVPLTTTLSGLLTQINIFSMRIFIFIAQTFLSEIELQVEAITRSKQWFFFFFNKMRYCRGFHLKLVSTYSLQTRYPAGYQTGKPTAAEECKKSHMGSCQRARITSS